MLRNSAIRAGGYSFGAALFFAAFVLIARYLGTTGFGHFSFIMAFAGIFQLLADMGVRNILIRNIALDKTRFREHLSVARSLLWIFSLVSIVSIVAISHLIDSTDEIRQSTWIAGLAVVFIFYGLGYSAVLRAFEEMGWDILGFVLHKIVFILLVLAVRKTDFGLRGVFGAMLAANACQWLYFWVVVSLRHGRAKLSLDLRASRLLLSEAFPLGIAEILKRLTRHVDKLLLTALSTPAAVGIFSAGYKFIEAIHPLLINLTLPLFPIFSRMARTSPAQLFSAYEQSLKFIYAAGLPLAVVVFVFSERITVLFFGEAYREAALALSIIAPAIVFLLSTSTFGYVFTAMGHQRTYMICIAASLVVNTLLDLMLIPTHSYVGAAIGTLAAETFLFSAGLLALRRLGDDSAGLRLLWRPCLAGLAMGTACWIVRDETFPMIMAGTLGSFALYVVLLFLLQTFTREERVLLTDAFRLRLGNPT